jgi:hypothetical protein
VTYFYRTVPQQISELQWEEVLRQCGLSMSRGRAHWLIYTGDVQKVQQVRAKSYGCGGGNRVGAKAVGYNGDEPTSCTAVTGFIFGLHPVPVRHEARLYGEGRYTCLRCSKRKPSSEFSRKAKGLVREICTACDSRARSARRKKSKALKNSAVA